MRNLEAVRHHLRDLAWMNLRASNDPRFIEDMVTSLLPGMLRLHVGGDFYSPAYVKKWWKILNEREDITAWAYTRSWAARTRSMRRRFKRWLTRLDDLPNVQILCSFDEDMDHPHNRGYGDFRTAFMSVHDETIDIEADVVFRVGQRRAVKVDFDGSPVCPTENGLAKNGLMAKPTCGSCRWCFQDCVGIPAPMDLKQIARKFVQYEGLKPGAKETA